jgi:transmembrane 9 superfamily protein 2/4
VCGRQYYYVFGFLLLVYCILAVTCAEITIVLNYFQLCSEDYRWWWRSLLTSGSTALYVFLYSIAYFARYVPQCHCLSHVVTVTFAPSVSPRTRSITRRVPPPLLLSVPMRPS